MTSTASTLAAATRRSPFPGLTHFGSSDEPYFFGREAEREILAANLIVSRLTIVYGPSGVGKSSLLRAGVQHDLLLEAESAIAAGKRPEHLIVLHAGPWQEDAVRAIDDAIRTAARDVPGLDPPEPDTLPLDEQLMAWTRTLNTRLLIILDQFEEFLLYADTAPGLRLDEQLPRAITRTDLDADFMISIREDALAGLDRFKSRISNLFETRVRVEHLDRKAAERAIREPVRRWNGEWRKGQPPIEVEDALINAVLDQVRTGQVVVGQQGRGAGEQADRIETPHLQLVMERLWEAEDFFDEQPRLRRAMLDDLGGAQQIVITRGREAIDKLPPEEQGVVAAIFDRLVTPSGAKIAHSLEDLAMWAKVEPEALRPILDKLCAGDLRILRPIAPPAGAGGGPRYELFHDVLARAILDWQARYQQEEAQTRLAKQLAAEEEERRRAEEQAERERRSAGRARILAALSFVIAVIAIAALVLGVTQWRDARAQTASARSLLLAKVADEQLFAHPGASLLLGYEAYRVKHSAEAVNSVLSALEASQLSGTIRFLHGHDGGVDHFVLSPDGRTLASAGADATVRLWDAHTGKELGEPLLAHKGPVNDVAFAPRGGLLASAGADGSIRLWDVGRRTLRRCKLGADKGQIYAIAFTRDGRTLLSGGADGLRLWNLQACTEAAGSPLDRHSVDAVALSPDGSTIATAGQHGLVEIRKLGGRTPRLLTGHKGLVRQAVFGPGGRVLAAAGDDGTIRLWRLASGPPLGPPIDAGRGTAWASAFSSDGRRLATSDDDGVIRIWDLRDWHPGRTRRPEKTLRGHTGPVYGLTFIDGDRRLFSGGDDGTIRVWDLQHLGRRGQPVMPRSSLVYSVAFNRDGLSFASAGDDKLVRLWNARTGTQLGKPLRGHTAPVTTVAYSRDGTQLASGGLDGTVRLWNPATHKQVSKLPAGTPNVHSVAFSPDGHRLAWAGDNGTIRVWDLEGKKVVASWTAGSLPVESVAFSPDGHTLATGGDDWAVWLWDPDDPTQQPEQLEGPASPVYSVAFSPDGRVLATGEGDKKIRIWDVRRRTETGQPLTSDGEVRTVAFSPDGRMLVAGGGYGKLRLWDVRRQKQLGQPLDADSTLVAGVAFSPDRRTFASGGVDGIRIWRQLLWYDVGELRRRICGLVGGGLSHNEWQRLVPNLPYHQSCP